MIAYKLRTFDNKSQARIAWLFYQHHFLIKVSVVERLLIHNIAIFIFNNQVKLCKSTLSYFTLNTMPLSVVPTYWMLLCAVLSFCRSYW